LHETLVKPVGEILPQATAAHGLDNVDLVDAPAWPDIAALLTELVHGRGLIAHNASST